jgi:hypothetical protein
MGVTFEAKLTPHRLLGILWSYEDILEIDFYVDTKDFTAVTYRCDFLDKNGGATMDSIPMGAISRIAFRSTSDGRLFARHTSWHPGDGRGGVRCNILGLMK